MKTIRDAVHGDMVFTPLEMEIVDTAPFQRLRGVRQLGTSNLVFPSANHSRFEHSLGACFMSGKIMGSMRQNTGRPGLFAGEETVIRAAALLHDVTHVPFGHTFEDERRLFPRHDEDPARFGFMMEESGIGAVLRREGLSAGVREILSSGAKAAVAAHAGREIVSGTICADLLDYLKRDALFCGFSLAYDERIFRYMSVSCAKDPGARDNAFIFDLRKGGELRADALSELVNLLRMRYTLTERVYYHHAKVASGAMISMALDILLREGTFRPGEIFGLRDDEFLALLAGRGGRGKMARGIVEDLLSHRLYRCVFVLRPEGCLEKGVPPAREAELERLYHFNEDDRRWKAECALAEKLGLAPGEVIIHCPAAGMSLREARVPVRTGNGGIVSLESLRLPEIDVLMQKHRSLWRLRVLLRRSRMDQAGKLAEACAELFGEL